MTPEQIHLALNHVPVIGITIAIVPIIVGYVLRNRALLVTGLALAAVAAWFTPLVMNSGERAYERYDHGPVRGVLDPNVEHYLHEHEERAETWAKTMYAVAILATLALVFARWKPGLVRPMAVVVCVAGVVAVASGIWIAKSGGEIRRVDFRGGPPPATADDHDSHDHDHH